MVIGMAASIGNEVRTFEIPDFTRRNLLFGTIGGLFVPLVRDESPAIVTSKNRVQSPSCTLASEQTEGPYCIDGALIRSNITEGRPGIPLRLRIIVLDGLRCKPVENAAVSIWHCDASGIYSGFTAAGAGRGWPRLSHGATILPGRNQRCRGAFKSVINPQKRAHTPGGGRDFHLSTWD